MKKRFQILLYAALIIPIIILAYFLATDDMESDFNDSLKELDSINVRNITVRPLNNKQEIKHLNNFHITDKYLLMIFRKFLINSVHENAYPDAGSHDIFIIIDLYTNNESIFQVTLHKNHDSDITYISITRPFNSIEYHSYDEQFIYDFLDYLEIDYQ